MLVDARIWPLSTAVGWTVEEPTNADVAWPLTLSRAAATQPGGSCEYWPYSAR